MCSFAEQLFNGLNVLVNSNECFFKQEHNVEGVYYWVFGYRLTKDSDFDLPYSTECRGHTFEVTENGTFKRLACLPMHKFFNMNEREDVRNLNFSDPHDIEIKSDGSLISTLLHKGELRLKSKMSFESSQAVNAMTWLQTNKKMYDVLLTLARRDFTVNLEWVGPTNRIVVKYPEHNMIVLNVRNNKTGDYIDIEKDLPELEEWRIGVQIYHGEVKEFIDRIEHMQNIEGYVVKFKSGKWVKIKTEWYRQLHKSKDSVFNNKALYACIVNECADELKSLFYDDDFSLNRILVAEEFVSKNFNHLVKVVEDFYECNKTLDRKSYAVKGQHELPKHIFSLAMEKYIGRPVDYKSAMIKFYDLYPLPLLSVER